MDKSAKADSLKALFNVMWSASIRAGDSDGVAYQDMVRIADALRSEGTSILNQDSLPSEIEAGLQYALAIVDPTRARIKQHVRLAVSALGGAGGVALAWICLGPILNPSVWAIIAAWFKGGFAFGPGAVIGVISGLTLVSISLYAGLQRQSPSERAVLAHKCVTAGINKWTGLTQEDGTQPPDGTATGKEVEVIQGLMLRVAMADQRLTSEEVQLLQLKKHSEIPTKEQMEWISQQSLSIRILAFDACCAMADADGVVVPAERMELRSILNELKIPEEHHTNYSSYIEAPTS